ncbi:hypothetical protein D3C86_1674130 [compost metagenome]
MVRKSWTDEVAAPSIRGSAKVWTAIRVLVTTQPIPRPRMMLSRPMAKTVVWAGSRAKSKKPRVMRAAPAMASRRKPKRFRRWPLRVEPATHPNEIMVRTVPVTVGLAPSTPCTKSGRKLEAENKEAPASRPMSTGTLKTLRPRRRTGIRGSGVRNW